MKRRKSLFYHLSHIRLLAKKFALVLLFLFAFVLMLINKTDTALIDKTSSVATDIVSSVIDVLVVPAKLITGAYDYVKELGQIREENQRLRDENKVLLQIRDDTKALEIENKILARLLDYVVPPEAEYITVRVIAEENDAFSHSLIAYTGNSDRVRKGQVVLSDRGVVGRIESVGRLYSKIILITDINSKIPVMVERTRVRGILTGDNTPSPKMVFIPLEAELTVGDRIVTSGVAGVFPAGLPIGKISSIEKNNVKIVPFTDLERMEYVKIVDYGL